MQRTDFGEMACSIARTFDLLGEPWTALEPTTAFGFGVGKHLTSTRWRF